MEHGIRIEHMTKTLGEFKLEDIHFSMKQGYVLGLIGRNGAGKSTLLNTIMGIWTPEQGRIHIGDYDRISDVVKAKDEIAFVTDECILPVSMSPYSIGKLFRRAYAGFHYNHYKKLCRRFGLPMHKSIFRMSKGMVIKLQIALAFSREAKLYIFDEPSAGLDPVFRKEFIDIIFDLIQDGTKTVIFSTHLTDELDRIADYILFLEKGKQLFFEEKEELINHYRVLRGSKERLEEYEEQIIGKRITETCCEALIKIDMAKDPVGAKANESPENTDGQLQVVTPTIEDIMYYFLKGTVI